MRRSRRSRMGFTLVELLVVIAILSVLAGLLVPSVISVNQKSGRAVCLNNLGEISKLSLAFAQDHRNRIPVAGGKNPPAYRSMQLLVDGAPYLRPELFICPSSLQLPAVANDKGHFDLDPETCSYSWRRKTTVWSVGERVPLASDLVAGDRGRGIEGHDRGMNVAYIDTIVEWLPVERLPEGRDLPEGLVGHE